MISFKSFTESIYRAIVEANASLMDQNIKLLERFLESGEGLVGIDERKTESDSNELLRAKTIDIEYPTARKGGYDEHLTVQVPLVTLIPYNPQAIESIQIEIDFEMKVVRGEIQMLFPGDENAGKTKRFTRNPTPSGAPGHIKMTVSPTTTPEGLKDVIKGYEKLLKLQIPS